MSALGRQNQAHQLRHAIVQCAAIGRSTNIYTFSLHLEENKNKNKTEGKTGGFYFLFNFIFT